MKYDFARIDQFGQNQPILPLTPLGPPAPRKFIGERGDIFTTFCPWQAINRLPRAKSNKKLPFPGDGFRLGRGQGEGLR
jgi:hypothetical protein